MRGRGTVYPTHPGAPSLAQKARISGPETADSVHALGSGILESALSEQAWRIRLAAYGARLERVLG